jgi:1-acyl-sn-glycerol-3-phosphate acyltransferase
MSSDSQSKSVLPIDLEKVLPLDAMRRIADVGLIGFLSEYVQQQVEGEPALQWDPSFLAETLPFLDYVLRYFDAEVEGFEHLPEEGPMLLVGNHSGGTLVPDVPVFIAAWYRAHGLDRPLMALAFDAVFALPGIAKAARKAGVMPANADNAHEALASGSAVMVYPGGDHDAYRPWTDRNRIDFGDRKGFVKLALREGVPVVPVVGHGAHESLVVISRGDSFSSAMGLDRLRMTVMPLVWQFPWGLSLPFVPGIPLPVKVSMQVGPALDWSGYGPEAADDPVIVDRCYEEITGAMQSTLDQLAEAHPHPLMERIQGLLPRTGRSR